MFLTNAGMTKEELAAHQADVAWITERRLLSPRFAPAKRRPTDPELASAIAESKAAADARRLAGETKKLTLTRRRELLTQPYTGASKELFSFCTRRIQGDFSSSFTKENWDDFRELVRGRVNTGRDPQDPITREEFFDCEMFAIANNFLLDDPTLEAVFQILVNESCLRVAQLSIEPEPEKLAPEPVNPYPWSDNPRSDYARHDLARSRRELHNELVAQVTSSPVWEEACRSIVATSGLDLPGDEILNLKKAFLTGKFGEESVRNIRRCAFAQFGVNNVGLTEEEESEREDAELSATAYRRKHSIPVNNSYGYDHGRMQ